MRLVVTGSSMLPCFHKGEIVSVEAVSPEQIAPGNAILFEVPGRGPTVHRVISTRAGITTRGDNARRADGVIPPERILGRVVARYRRGKEVRISRAEELLWLRCAPAIRAARFVLRSGARSLAPHVYPLLPLEAVRYVELGGEQVERIRLLKKTVAWRKRSAGHVRTWIHPVFSRTPVAEWFLLGAESEPETCRDGRPCGRRGDVQP